MVNAVGTGYGAVAGKMSFAWYVNRLRNMGAAEILHRVVEKARKTSSRHRHGGWERYAPVPLTPVFPGLRERVAHAADTEREAIALAAENVLAGKFSALGRTWPQRAPDNLFPDDLWSLDPVTGRHWPGADTYTFDINYRHDGSRGDIKYAWEIGRLQALPVLAMHHVLVGEDEALVAIEEAIESWHRANPPFTGIGWASGIEVALRCISLIVVRDLLVDELNVATTARVNQILSASLFWLKRFPSLHSSANNHLVAELAGEYLIGLALAQNVEQAERHLSEELLKQIFGDGGGAEQSPTYAAFTVELVLFCLAAARENGRDFGTSINERLQVFASFIAWLPSTATFGDDDEGRVLTLGAESDYVGSAAAAIAGFFDVTGIASPQGDMRGLFFGRPKTFAQKPSGLRVFEQSGLSIWQGRSGDRAVELVFDHGALGYLSIAAHGHADALSLTLAIDGKPVLVDPGTWAYGSGGIWRNWFRSTMAHNTLNIAGESQSIMSGAFNWSHKADAALVEYVPGETWSLTAEHGGYEQRFGARHQRTIRLDQGNIIVTDRLLGTARPAEIAFQLAPHLAAHIDGTLVRVMDGEVPVLHLQFPEGDISVSSGGEKPGDGGWVSPRFGVKMPAPRLCWNGSVGGSGVDVVLSPVMPVVPFQR